MKDKTGKELSKSEVMQKGVIRAQSIAEEFGIYFLYCVGYIPSHLIRRFFYRLAGIKIKKGSTIHIGARFYETSHIVIGEDTIVGENIVLDGRDKLTIGDHVDIASEVMIYNSKHDIE